MAGRLIKVIDGELVIAYERVAAPGYTIYVSDAQSSNGWTYYDEELEKEHFALPWKRPTDATNAYNMGDIVAYNGTRWRSTIIGNVWEPGVSGWVDADSELPDWNQPTGAHDAYIEGAIVKHNGKIWENITKGTVNTWEPGVSGWREAVRMPPDGSIPAPPNWVQPTGAHDDYAIGDKVTHNGFVWTSIVDNNVWEPGVYGWTQDV